MSVNLARFLKDAARKLMSFKDRPRPIRKGPPSVRLYLE